MNQDIMSACVRLRYENAHFQMYVSVGECVCVCACLRETERQSERGREKERERERKRECVGVSESE